MQFNSPGSDLKSSTWAVLISLMAAIYFQVLPPVLKLCMDEAFRLDAMGWIILTSLCFFQISITTLPGRSGFLLGLLVLGLAALSTLLNLLNIAIFKSPISIITLSTTIQSNSHEVSEFMETYGSRLFLSSGIHILISALLFGFYRSAWRPQTFRIAASMLCLALLCSGPVLYRSMGHPKQFFQAYHELAYVDRFLTSLVRYRSIMEARKNAQFFWGQRDKHKQQLKLTAANENQQVPLVVIVIGESTTRNHMGIYGYHRSTTPNLENMKDQLIVFRDAISPVASTLPAVIGALCSSRFNMDTLECGGPNLLEIAQAAGYRTSWISNQAPTGFGDNFLVELGKMADSSIFVNRDVSSAGEADYSKSFDEKILSPFDDALKNLQHDGQKSMIFIHLMGTHFIYEKRYPKDQALFQSTHDLKNPDERAKRLINHYDNAVAYQDKILGQILNRINASEQEALFFYFSDHGEEVYDSDNFAGHSEDRVTPSMREIPFIVGYSASYAQRHAKKLARLKTCEQRSFSSFQLTSSIAGLLGLSSDEYSPQDDVFSPAFTPSRGFIRAAGNSAMERL